MAIPAFQSTKIGSIEIRLHTNIIIFPSVNILCDKYLDGLSKAEIGQILLHSCIYTINGAILLQSAVSKTYWKCRRRNYIFLDSSERLSAFIGVSDKFDKFSDSSGFRRSFLRLKQILSFLPISKIDRKDSCVRNI